MYTGGILTQDYVNIDAGDINLNHVVNIVGWGTTNDGIEYWIARNSWGETWGERGFFRIEKGKNTLGIESRCNFAIPKNNWKDIDNLLKNETSTIIW